MSEQWRVALMAPQVGPLDAPGEGIARYTVELARGLARRGHTVAVFTDGPVATRDEADGVTRHVVAVRPGRRRPYVRDFIARARALAAPLRAFSPTIIEATNYGAPALLAPGAVPLVIRCSTPDALAAAGGDDASTLGQALSVVVEGLVLRRARARIYLSEESRRAVTHVYRLPDDDGVVIPHALPDPGPLPPGAPAVALHVGALSLRKGTDVLLRAFADVAARDPTARLVLVGRDHALDHDDALRAVWAELPPDVRARVERRGRVDERALAHAYAEAGLVIVPSRFESFGLVALEALLRGRPVLAAQRGALEEVLGDDGARLLFPSGDASALAQRWRALLAAPDDARALGAALRRSALVRFDPERMLDATLGVYASVLR